MVVETQLPDGFCVSDDPARLDLDVIQGFLSNQSYWARGRERSLTLAAMAGSHCFGVYGPPDSVGCAQLGFARVVTDHALFAWIADVFILPEQRGRGLGHALVHAIVTHPRLAGVRRMMLVTEDAPGLYRQHGFAGLDDPGRYMSRRVATAKVSA